LKILKETLSTRKRTSEDKFKFGKMKEKD